jgi:hypothetical protein
MPLLTLLLGLPGLALLFVLLAGLVIRRRLASCWSFGAYLLAILVSTLITTAWPERFYTYVFFSQRDTLLFVLKVGVALEIGGRAFSILPRARVRGALLFTGVLLATAWAVWSVPYGESGYRTLAGSITPLQQAGCLWLFAILAAATSWYRVPLCPLHRSILVGFAFYLTAVTAIITLISWGDFDGPTLRLLGILDSAAYLAVEAFWTWGAWQPVRVPSPTFATLQPWARSW